MIVTTTFDVEGYRIKEYLGVVRGIVVRVPTITQNISASIKTLIGGRVGAYTEMCEHAREEAFRLMVEQARRLGADAVVGVRYDTSNVEEKGVEVLCYGTAVKLEKIEE